MNRVRIAPGYAISRIIKGGWQLAGGHGAVDAERAVRDMFAFAEAGITTFDCADIYQGVEERIGVFLERWRRCYPAAAPIQVHTKFVPDLSALATLSAADVERAIDRSLRRLGVEALDLVQFHWWDYSVPRFVEVALWLQALQRKGKIRHLGATNFDVPALRAIADAGVSIVSHQVQYSIVDRRPENGMTDFCRQRGIAVLCYGSLLGGFLDERWLGAAEPSGSLENRSLVKYKLILDEFGAWARFQRLLARLVEVGRPHGATAGAVALRFVLDRPQVAAAIVGARDANHLAETLRAEAIQLDPADMARLEAAVADASGPLGDTYALERRAGGRHASIMRYNLNQATE